MLEIYQVLDNHAGKAIGLDVSEWENQLVDVDTLKINIPFTLFSFGPPGNDRLDKQFDENLAPKAATLSGSLSLIVLTKIH
jgi:hypothetical protein